MYNRSFAPGKGLVITARFSKYFFRSSKALSCCRTRVKIFCALQHLKIGRDFSVDREMNLFSEARRPVNFCTSFLVEGGRILLMASIFTGFALMPLSVIMHLRSFPLLTPKTHFSGFNLSPCLRRVAKVSRRSEMWSSRFFALHDNIVNVRRNVSVELGVKYCCDGLVECASCIAKPLRHSYIAIRAEGSSEAGLFFI